jgi:hypothetical protein
LNIAEPAIMQSTDPDLKLHGSKQEADICLLFWDVLAGGQVKWW